MKKILITGGAGFIGSNLIRFILRERPEWQVINFDLLTYAGNLVSLAGVEDNPSYRFIRGDVADPDAVKSAMEGCWGVMHLAAESHVDRSILDPGPFLTTNVLGTRVMLDAARFHGVERFVQVSTDEVYGSLKPTEPPFTEENHIVPNSPYSASKAAGDLLARSYFKTFGLPVVITRCSNNYGPFTFPEKLIPLVIRNAQRDKPIPVYGDGKQVRDWIYVEDHCRGLLDVFEKGEAGSVYNLGGNCEIQNIDLIKMLLDELNKPESLITFVKDRPGHDRRYAMDSTRIESELGWKPSVVLREGIPKTVKWYLENEKWIQSVVTGEYKDYYRRQYEER